MSHGIHTGIQSLEATNTQHISSGTWLCHTPLIHPSYTPHTPLIHPSYTPHTPLIHPSYTPHTPLIHPSYTPHTPPVHSSYTPLTRLIHPTDTPLTSWGAHRQSVLPCRRSPVKSLAANAAPRRPAALLTAVANPKSASFNVLKSPGTCISRFSSFTSRCTYPSL